MAGFKGTQMLYLIPNTTAADGAGASSSAPPSDLVVPVLDTLISITGTQSAPAKDITITNVNFRDAGAVYEEQWEVPSGGDWAFHRSAAVQATGSEDLTLSGGTYKRLDGNGVMFSGYNRNATVQHSDFSYIGGNVMAAWGYTNETATDPGRSNH